MIAPSVEREPAHVDPLPVAAQGDADAASAQVVDLKLREKLTTELI